MRPKEPRQIGAWTFHMEDPEGNAIQVPPNGAFSNIDELHAAVLQYMDIFDGVTDKAYTAKQRELAESHNLQFTEYILQLIQHQMCIRNVGSIPCWSSGLGDSLHQAAGLVDKGISILPTTVRTVMRKMVAKVTPSHNHTLQGCQQCGGTSTFQSGANNLGRAGTVNNIIYW